MAGVEAELGDGAERGMGAELGVEVELGVEPVPGVEATNASKPMTIVFGSRSERTSKFDV